MKHTRLALLAALTVFASIPAYAASVTMLQFGSFETREEAEKRLSEIKAKHAADVGSLPVAVREVKLPPDNLTVYRTQAGPVADRATAQGICSKLAAGGDECYIVQTAMVAPAAEKLAATPLKEALPALSTVPAPTPSAMEPLKEKAESVLAPAPDLTRNLSTLNDVPARDPSNLSVLSRVHTAPTTTGVAVAAAQVESAAPSADMQKALDEAAQQQQSNVDKVDAAVAITEEKRPSRSFWSRLNPFSDDEPAPAPKPAAVPLVAAPPIEPVAIAPNPPVAALTPVPTENLPPLGQPAAIPAPAPVAQQAVVAMPAPQPIAVPQAAAPVAPLAAPTATVTSPVAALAPAPVQLPPPPAPLRAQDREMLLSAKPVARPVPVATGIIAQPEPLRPMPAGNVRVEEATRVAVTATPTPPSAPHMQPLSQMPAVALQPSTTDGQKTLWAQIGPFADGDAALGFWSGFRQAHPDFPVVRVRVTAPYQQQLRGNQQTWLRVGPMARDAFISNLCMSMPAQSNLRCGRVTDMGIASKTERTLGVIPGTRYKR